MGIPTVHHINQMNKQDFLQLITSVSYTRQTSCPNVMTASEPSASARDESTECKGAEKSKTRRKRPPRTQIRTETLAPFTSVTQTTLATVDQPCSSSTDDLPETLHFGDSAQHVTLPDDEANSLYYHPSSFADCQASLIRLFVANLVCMVQNVSTSCMVTDYYISTMSMLSDCCPKKDLLLEYLSSPLYSRILYFAISSIPKKSTN